MRKISSLNEDQRLLAETTEGMVIADAGPGTGKTFTVVERYMNIIGKNVDPSKILMVTFTRNGAQEMTDRITNELFKRVNATDDEEERNKLINSVKNVRVSTFDALCLKIVMNSPDIISDFFGIKEVLSRNVRLYENDTMNLQFFDRFYTEFASTPDIVDKYGKGKDNLLAAVSGLCDELYWLISNLMCRGIIPKHKGWFDDGGKILFGHPSAVKSKLNRDIKKFESQVKKIQKEKDEYSIPDDFNTENLGLIDASVDEDRSLLIDFVHDLFFSYIRKSISENRLTFGLASIFAFAALYEDERTRRSNKFDYLMVDEFQDTNELQMLVCLLILNKPNLCVVGDWKQSIYGFRYANMDNIVKFDDRVDLFITKLNRDGTKRVPFGPKKAFKVNLRINYRSSSKILKTGFDVFNILDEKPEGEIVELTPNRAEEIGEHTNVEFIRANSKEDEIKFVVSKIIEYVTDPKYVIVEKGVERRPRYRDIAVLSRPGKIGRQVLEECINRGVPAFYQGDLEIMSTREGKLALAWLRFINNRSDRRGLIAILVDYGYSLDEIRKMQDTDGDKKRLRIPEEIDKARNDFKKKSRRPTDLLTAIFGLYGDLDPDIVQSIINILSSAYDGTLSTISDLIMLIENDIRNGTKYDIDQSLRSEAVTIQTLHKSKGLEYPIVIVAGINTNTFPNNRTDDSKLCFNEDIGLRFKRELIVSQINGSEQANICSSWRWGIISIVAKKDPFEDIRLFFVGITRAKQYITFSSADTASKYFTHYRPNDEGVRNDLDMSIKADEAHGFGYSDAPDIKNTSKIKRNISVHDIMDTFADVITEGRPDDNNKGKGPEYGEKVHKMAFLLGKGITPADDYPDLDNVRKVLKKVEGSDLNLEIKCAYPIGQNVIRGVMDVLAVFDDRIEIHDYKTDQNARFLPSYEAQLSIYYHCVREYYGDSRPILCFVDFISPDFKEEDSGARFHEIKVMKSVKEIEQSILEYEKRLKSKEALFTQEP